MKFKEAIQKAIEIAPKRNFLESVEIIFGLKGLNPKKPESKFELKVTLPEGLGKELKICAFADDNSAKLLEGKVDKIIKKDELDKITPRQIRKLRKQYDWFIVCPPELIKEIAARFAKYLSPKRRMPVPIPPIQKAIEVQINNLKKTVLITNKSNVFCVQCKIGTKEMDIEKLAKNAETVYNELTKKIDPKHIKKVFVKTTMGPAVEVSP
jgi:large subunit ribosomal protein L1